MGKTKHAILSASGSKRWLQCPGSIRMSVGMPKSSSVFAAEGTAAHKLADMKLRDGGNAIDELGNDIQVEGAVFEVTEEMAEAVQLYLDLVREEVKLAGKGTELKVENRFKLDWLYNGLYGTNDAMICQPFGKATVIDFKYGKGVAVEVMDNPQLCYYALGGTQGQGYEEVEIVICQPRANHPDGLIRRQLFGIDDLMKWGQEVLLPGAKATEDPNAPLVLSDECRFCPALAVCPEQKKQAYEVAKVVFDDIPALPVVAEKLSYPELKRILDVADTLDAWLNSCRKYVQTLLESGKADPSEIGYKLVAGRQSRKWTDEAVAEAALIEILGQKAFTRKLISPAQAEKNAVVKEQVAKLVTVTRGVQLAPLSDKREPLQPAIAAFGEVDI